MFTELCVSLVKHVVAQHVCSKAMNNQGLRDYACMPTLTEARAWQGVKHA